MTILTKKCSQNTKSTTFVKGFFMHPAFRNTYRNTSRTACRNVYQTTCRNTSRNASRSCGKQQWYEVAVLNSLWVKRESVTHAKPHPQLSYQALLGHIVIARYQITIKFGPAVIWHEETIRTSVRASLRTSLWTSLQRSARKVWTLRR